jgi:4-diphosphocytidyl-2-C-methyl-D-erythritol kinase
MAAATVRAQAKINLFLKVVGREASGYHHLETLFCRIDLADVVSVRLTPTSRSLDCSGPELPAAGLGTVPQNLAWRAAVAYADVARWPSGFAIELEKHIPVSSGLGGGSADAGAVLRALNGLNSRPLDEDVLQQIARTLGADVPFVTQATSPTALALWRGDELLSVPPLPERTCLLAIPPVRVDTRAAYSWLDDARGWTDCVVTAPTADTGFPDAYSWADVRRSAHNDFEEVVFSALPEIADAWRYLSGVVERIDLHGFTRMSGSGSASFGILAGGRPAPARLDPAPPGVRTIVCRTSGRVESVDPID